MGWCGSYKSDLWQHGTLAPCKTGTIAASIFLAAAAIVGLAQYFRIQTVVARRPAPLSLPTAKQAVSSTAYGFIALLHAAWLTYLVLGPHAYFAPFELAYELTLLLIWSGALVLLYFAHRQQSQALARAILSFFQLVLLLAAALNDSCRSTPQEEEDLLKQALLQPADPEAGEKKPRSWPSLLLTAIVYVWPDTPGLQVRAVLCVFIIVIMRLLNLAVPILYKHVVDTMANVSARTHPTGPEAPQTFNFMQVFSPWVLSYIVISFFQGGPGTASSGLMNNCRQFLWIPITQNAYRRISLELFQHVLNLDLKFHLMRKTGEVMRVMDRGTGSIQSILSTVLFNIVPQMFDILAACIYIASVLEPWIAIIMFVTLASYLPLTIFLTEWRTRYRRDMNKLDNAKDARATDALLNYETVKYFSNDELEHRQFEGAITAYQGVEYKALASLNILNVIQSSVIFVGVISGLTVCTNGVAKGKLTNMFDILAVAPEIKDKPGAKKLLMERGEIEFNRVSFEYSPGSPVIQDISFKVAGGSSVALVGATGSGKSTCLRLLFRFYDPTAGCIRVDGQDLRDVTQKSLRTGMAVVPQDTVLFNDTILTNIRYGRPDASDAEVFAAAQAAAIHSNILERFPQQYETIVGERGLRLSGGEKQRVAFARAILKNPRILLLDEATSSLDTLTERRIQDALHGLKADRTTFIVAHRLSTIMDADLIVVMNQGKLVETGQHPELIQKGGLYAQMWSRQAEDAAATPFGSTQSLADSTAAMHANGDHLHADDSAQTNGHQ
ncbi:hypothetical protein WJX84_009107 [Apatococcus fuscideae]|uniref:ABC transporter n=1 Tax=Apatococcus fuscideae TaxID=2026836 RepID=A0AAW1T748_9CHLO